MRILNINQLNNQLSKTLLNTKSHNLTYAIKKVIFGFVLFSMSIPLFAQVNELPEIEISSVNFKYYNSVATQDVKEIIVKKLEERAALYDPKEYINTSYNDDYDIYKVTFSMPNGKILAVYDESGKIVKTSEKFKNVRLPRCIQNAIAKRFPNWALVKNIYQVSYYDGDSNCNCDNSNLVRKDYMLKLKNGNKVVTIKTDEMGNFL